MTNKELAETIATDILTVQVGMTSEECTRAQMMIRQPDGSERNMGGRNKESIVGTILPHLEAVAGLVEALEKLCDNTPMKSDATYHAVAEARKALKPWRERGEGG